MHVREACFFRFLTQVGNRFSRTCQTAKALHKIKHVVYHKDRLSVNFVIGRLAEIFLELQGKGANNINLVTPTHYTPEIIWAVKEAREKGLVLPIVYNCSGYEKVETLRNLEGIVDIYLTDFKYMDKFAAKRYSRAEDYPEIAALDLYKDLMSEYSSIEDAISVARRNYNAIVMEYNNMVDGVFTGFIAKSRGFERIEEFKAAPEANGPVHIDLTN